MFSDLPGLFDRNFVVGYLLPAILLVVATCLIISLASGFQIIGLQLSSQQFGTSGVFPVIQDVEGAALLLAALALQCLILAAFLLATNHVLVRFLEGYLPPISWLRPVAIKRYRRFRARLDSAIEDYLREHEQGEITTMTKKRYRELLRTKVDRYPDQEEFVLATTFGNVIRAAEVYSRLMYGADSIPIWPRLLAVVEAEFKKSIESAKAMVDFSVNGFFACFILIFEALVLFSLPADRSFLWSRYWITFPLLMVLCVGFYRLAVSSALQWGILIRATSDLYLDDLAETLRIELPKEQQQRKAMWQAISRSFLYLEPLPALGRNQVQDGDTRNTVCRSLLVGVGMLLALAIRILIRLRIFRSTES